MAKAKYRTKAYRAARRNLEQRMLDQGYLTCVETPCLMPSKVIKPGQKWHVCHSPDGLRILGPGHARCNTSEGATRGNQQRKPRRWIP